MLIQYFSQIILRQEILIEQLSTVCKVLANMNDMAIEDVECDDDDLIGLN